MHCKSNKNDKDIAIKRVNNCYIGGFIIREVDFSQEW